MTTHDIIRGVEVFWLLLWLLQHVEVGQKFENTAVLAGKKTLLHSSRIFHESKVNTI